MGQCKCHFAATPMLLGYFYFQKHDHGFFFPFQEDGFKVGIDNKIRNLTAHIVNNLSCISIGHFFSFERNNYLKIMQ